MSKQPFWLRVGKRLVEADQLEGRCRERPRRPAVRLRDKRMLSVGWFHKFRKQSPQDAVS